METQERTIIENIGQQIRRSVTLKLVIIFILMLLLIIPVTIISELITEREQMRQQAVNEVTGKWAEAQHIYGPVLTLPFNKRILEDDKVKVIREEAHLLPSQLNINGAIEPQILHRGIYEVVVYSSAVSVSGSFAGIQKQLAELEGHEVLWDEAFLTIGISDLRGIKGKVVVKWSDNELPVEPGTRIPDLIESGITVGSLFENPKDTGAVDFSFNLHLQGSRHLGFAPFGKETRTVLASNWQDPSFSGAFLPDDRSVSEEGFRASYRIIELNRNYPQFWVGTQYAQSIRNSVFGVDLILPVNDYQKAMRSVKYALLAISLTFLTFFLVEVFNRKKIHPFQYTLIGLALVLFYTLLVSISEHASFEVAYAVAGVSVIAMIGLYAKAILESIRQTVVLVSVLLFTYLFVYINLQIQEYALLTGSLGLTAILAITMYITRKINWYKLA